MISPLKLGATGDNVVKLQNILNYFGLSATLMKVDGKFGSVTQNNVKAFQQAAGLLASGTVDALTGRAIATATLLAGIKPSQFNQSKMKYKSTHR